MNLFSALLDHARTGKPVRTSRPSLEVLEDRAVPTATPGVSTVAANFNATPVPPGDSVWFSSVADVSGVGAKGATVQVVDSAIDFTANGKTYQVAAPNVTLTFSPTAKAATTSFDPGSDTWTTTVPVHPGGKVFLDGVALPLPQGLPGGVKDVTWTGTYLSSTPGLKINWQWSAAAYRSLASNYNSLDVKPVDGYRDSAYHDFDRAGTPEAFKGHVVAGARGHGGANYTGWLSETASVKPAQPVAAQASLSGSVIGPSGAALAGATVTLTWTTASGTTGTLTTTTNSQGAYTFSGLAAGVYALSQTGPAPYTAQSASVGTVGGKADGTASGPTLEGITLAAGQDGVNYNFDDGLTIVG